MAYVYDDHTYSNTAIYFYRPQTSSKARSPSPASHVIPPPVIAPPRLGLGEFRTANLPTKTLQKLPTTPPPISRQESQIQEIASFTEGIKCILDSENSIDEKFFHGITIEALPDIEGKLEETNLRYSYFADREIMILEVPSEPHEVGVQIVRHLLEKAMQAQRSAQSESEKLNWTYGTNSTHSIEAIDSDGELGPTGDKITPDGSIYDPVNGLSLVTEVASSQTYKSAMEKIQTAMQSPSVVGGILVNLEESPKYASPCSDQWQPAKYISAADYGMVQVSDGEGWGPREIAGYKFAGVFSCSMEVILRGDPSVSATLNPSGLTSQTTAIDKALQKLWERVVIKHSKAPPEQLDPFDVAEFCDRLRLGIDKLAHDRYQDAWFKRKGKRKAVTSTDILSRKSDKRTRTNQSASR